MIKFFLYSDEYPSGLKLAEVVDESTAYFLTHHYRNTYKPIESKVCVLAKHPRKSEKWIAGYYVRELKLNMI